MAQEVAVATRGLTKRYGESTVVSDLNMVVPRRAVYGFLGPNGAGKSTTMKMLLGLAHPTCGRAQVLGVPMTPENRLKLLRNMGSRFSYSISICYEVYFHHSSYVVEPAKT